MVTRYEEDFKKSIVEMVKAGRRPDELSKKYGHSADSIRNWVKKYAPVEVLLCQLSKKIWYRDTASHAF